MSPKQVSLHLAAQETPLPCSHSSEKSAYKALPPGPMLTNTEVSAQAGP